MVLAILILAAACTAMLVFLTCFAALQFAKQKRIEAWQAELSGHCGRADDQFYALHSWHEKLDKRLSEQARDMQRGMEILRAMEEKERRLDYDFDAAQRAAKEINRMNEGISQLFGYDGAPVQKKAGDGA